MPILICLDKISYLNPLHIDINLPTPSISKVSKMGLVTISKLQNILNKLFHKYSPTRKNTSNHVIISHNITYYLVTNK